MSGSFGKELAMTYQQFLRENLLKKKNKNIFFKRLDSLYIFVNKVTSDSEDYFGFILFIDNSLQHGSYHLYNDVTGLEPVSVIPSSKLYDRHSLKQLKST